MPLTSGDLDSFASELRRLRTQAEPTLYPAYRSLISRSYAPGRPGIFIDTNRRTPGAGFPDLTVLRGVLCLNWFEIKSPGVDVSKLPVADRARFQNYLRTLPHVVLTNGWKWIFHRAGVEVEQLVLPQGWILGNQPLSPEDQRRLIEFLTRLSTVSPSAAASDEEAVQLLATAANLIRLTIDGCDESDYPSPLRSARQSFTNLLRTNPADTGVIAAGDFSDALAQTTVFGFLLARVEAGTDVDPPTAHAALNTTEHPFLKNALYGLLAPDAAMETLLKGPLSAACDMINRAAPRLSGPHGDWSRVTYLYEDFFAAYRPEDRFRYGVFYTPMEITRYQVREVSRVLRDEFGLDGLNDPNVRFLDPACGTGTYLLALAEIAAQEAAHPSRGMPVRTALHDLFSNRVFGFEVSPGPACVAQARIASWLKTHHVNLGTRLPIYTVNTLTPPVHGTALLTGNLWADNVTAEQAAGDKVKAETPVLVVVGNPPWGRRDRREFDFASGHNLLASWSRGAGGAAQSIYDLYVAFWKFATELLLERSEVQPSKGIVSFITNRTWLRGRPFTTMRGYLRDRASVAWVTDLGGDVRAGEVEKDQGVFAIMAGSAISTMAFGTRNAPSVYYRRLLGNRVEKLTALNSSTAQWASGPSGRTEPLALTDWGALDSAPSIRDYFARSMPGIKTHRDHLVIDVDNNALLSKLEHWNALADNRERARVFHESRGRVVPSRQYVVRSDAIRRIRYRPLDNRWLYGDRQFIQEPGRITTVYENIPDGRCLLILDSTTVNGPVVIAANELPDYHSVRGSYGCHVLMLDTPQGSLFDANPGAVLSDWAAAWAASLGASIDDIAAYLLALGNAPDYTALFGDAVRSDPPRLPATQDPALFADAVEVGRDLLAAWCLTAPPIGQWVQAAHVGTPLGEAVINGSEVTFANGDQLVGLHPDTEQFEVSTYQVFARFLEARRHQSLTAPLAAEARQVAGAIKVILDSRQASNALLHRAISAPVLVSQ